MTSDDDLTPPACLQRTTRGPKFRAPRWSRMRARRPEVQGWEDCERWEVDAGPELCELAPHLPAGRYRYWVVVGRKWVQLRDHHNVHRLPVAEWERYKGKWKVG